jgi:hypothetical protein
MQEMLGLAIEVGIGLAGFSGITVALSGNPKTWSSAEKLRVGVMILFTLAPVFGSLLCITLTRAYDESLAARITSVFLSLLLFLTIIPSWLKVRAVHDSNDPTINRILANVLALCWFSVALMLLLNAAGLFADAFMVLFAALVWVLLMGAFLFVRILFKRPGTEDTG